MTRRPTYEELEQRVKELEKLEAKCKCAEEDLLDAEHKWMSLIENTNDFIMIIDNNGRIQYINRTIPPNTVDQVTGKTLYDFSAPEHHEMIRQTVAKTFETRKQGSYTSCVKHPTGIQWFETTVVPIIKEGKVSSAMSFNKIITERKQAEEALRKAHDELKERTRELAIKTNGLEEINTAIKVLLKKRKEDKTELEDNVLTNVKELVEPYFEKIKETKLDDQQEAFLSIIESNLKEIISPFTRKMSLKYLNLTPTEIRIANLIRHGSPSKKIAELLNVSPRTIDTHRKNIRRKIGLQGQRGNLRSHLLSLH